MISRAAVIFGVFCFVLGLFVGVLLTLYLTPTTPQMQDAHAALIRAQALVKEAEAERLRVEARADELALAQTAQVKVLAAWVNVFVVPVAALCVGVAALAYVRRQVAPAPLRPVGVLSAMPLDREPVSKQFVYVRGNTNEKGKRDLQDVREFIERGAVNGFARADWVGRGLRFRSGHECTRARYEELREMCLRANVLEPDGNTYRLACTVAEALDAFSDGEHDAEETQ